MMRFRKAVASEAKPLVGIYAESGAGKTKSALLLAKGFVGDMSRVFMIETESGRGEAYASEPDVGGYNVISLRESFAPKVYGEAIALAERENAQALIIDSASHEWEGVQGVLAMAAANQEAGKKGPIVWQQPKLSHAREFMLRLTQTPIPLVIVCMRAKYPMYQVKPDDLRRWEEAGRPGNQPKLGEWARSWELEPKQSDDILFEMFVHGWIDKEHRFHGTKYTVDTMRKVFIDKEPITVQTGERLAAWARGGSTNNGAAPSTDAHVPAGGRDAASLPSTDSGATFIGTDQVTLLGDMIRDNGFNVEKFCEAFGVASLQRIPTDRYEEAKDRLEKAIEVRKKKAAA